jgi:N-acetylglucosaminyldiphosphoundecaprenol N-acetyl-beta-D-mannosaminyltransferase
VVRRAKVAIERRETLVICAVNAPKLVRMRDDAAFCRAILDADLLLPDGMSLVWASRLLRRPLPNRITGIDVMYNLLAEAADQHHATYCLGATERTNVKAVAAFRDQYPGVRIVGRHHGYFAEADEPRVVEAIAGAAPDILFVAMNTPRKERFIARWSQELGVPVCLGVGGAFDVASGEKRRAPMLLQRAGLEWSWRMFQHPRRAWPRYLGNNASFAAILFRELLRPGSYGATLGE